MMAAATAVAAQVTAEIELIPHHTSINQFVSFWATKKMKKKKCRAYLFQYQFVYEIVCAQWNGKCTKVVRR